MVYAARCAPGEEHQAAWRLLALALERERGLRQLPEVARGEEGKPCFPKRPDICTLMPSALIRIAEAIAVLMALR